MPTVPVVLAVTAVTAVRTVSVVTAVTAMTTYLERAWSIDSREDVRLLGDAFRSVQLKSDLFS